MHVPWRKFNAMGSAWLETDYQSVIIHYGGREWSVDLSQIPIAAGDCEDPDASQSCAKSHVNCLDCISAWQPVVWDEPHQVFYMAAGTGTGKNKPWVIMAYDLRTGKLRRIALDNSGGFNGAAVSPTGRYLAYIGYAVCGVCCTTSDLRLIDTTTLKTGTFSIPGANAGELPRIRSIHWAGPSTIDYEAQGIRESDCVDGKPSERSWAASVQVAQVLEQR
jgi:hypothetical protein